MAPEDQIKGTLIKVQVTLPQALQDADIMDVASLLESEAISTSWEKTSLGWDLLWVTDFRPSAVKLARQIAKLSGVKLDANEIRIADVVETNWLEQSYRQFPPFQIGPFFIYGSHYKGNIPAKTIGLQIDAATAFGSGEHGTTKGCLEALHWLKQEKFRPQTILDMGTGSGILAIAAYDLWKKPTLAVDNDRESVRVACRHRKMNKIPAGENGVNCAYGDGYKTRRVRQDGPFKLIIANILAGPLIDMAPELAANLAKNSRVVLSGLLVEQEKEVLKAHKAHGLSLIKRIRHNGWSTLILQS